MDRPTDPRQDLLAGSGRPARDPHAGSSQQPQDLLAGSSPGQRDALAGSAPGRGDGRDGSRDHDGAARGDSGGPPRDGHPEQGRAPGGEPAEAAPVPAGQESLASLLGGRTAAVDATLPPVAFVLGWLLAGSSVPVGAATALVVGAGVAGWRLWRGDRPRAVLLGLLGVAVAAVIALRTGRAADFFLVQVASNAASALAWITSIVIRWPLLGVVVGTVLGQRGRWRRDPDLLRAYSRASWVWVAQYVLRLVVFVPLWWADAVIALGAARLALSWPLVAVCLGVSWWVLRRVLPAGHPGLRHPRT
ncbi:DUF3159 domain-containing protein [Longimycelium tulufanense]|uniref:DUF3159 domain-containing protein n=1 Tax=Longimycelium tulufanense TaxID=907463 RepID=UPI0027E5533E|nr:DUF3159 domain-containing protein [Longimycelium tulufanense]